MIFSHMLVRVRNMWVLVNRLPPGGQCPRTIALLAIDISLSTVPLGAALIFFDAVQFHKCVFWFAFVSENECLLQMRRSIVFVHPNRFVHQLGCLFVCSIQ